LPGFVHARCNRNCPEPGQTGARRGRFRVLARNGMRNTLSISRFSTGFGRHFNC
jgi:hypothetical protein